MPRVLVVESHPEDVRKIRELVSASLDAEIVVADSADAAEHAISTGHPALVLTSAVTTPAVEARVMAAVRRLPSSIPVPVLTLPPLADARTEPEPAPRGTFLSFFTRGGSKKAWPHYDAEALGQRIREALAQSLHEREWLASRERLWAEAAERQVEPAFLKPAEPHERAPRFTGPDMSGLSMVKLAWGLEVEVVNISRTGMLIESGARFSEGAREEFELSGAAGHVRAIARFVRSCVTKAEGPGVRYQTAAAFDAAIRLPLAPFRLRSEEFAGDTPAPLRDVLTWVQQEAARGMVPSQLLAAYELELQHLVRAREVRICGTPAIGDESGASVFFTVPGRDGDAVLRATFDPDYRPSRRALTLLRQAALLAPDVVELESTTLS
jgi:hypothetical protein